MKKILLSAAGCVLAQATQMFNFEEVVGETTPVIPTLEIADGVHMPMLLLGTWLYNDTQAYDALSLALDVGYPGVDTAYDYVNEKGVGQALAESGRARSQYWVTSKVEGGLTYQQTMDEHESNLSDLGIDYVDLLLVHFPFCGNGSAFSVEGRAEQWTAMEKLLEMKKTRSIGVSHFCKHHMNSLLETAVTPPALNQVEYHVGMGSAGPNATDDRLFHQQLGITYQPFSQFCGPCCMGQPENCTYDTELFNGPLVTGIGANYGKTGAQVSLRWLTQQNLPVIPRSNNVEHLKQNMDVFDWEMSTYDMAQLTNSLTPPVCGAGDLETSGDCSYP